MEFYTYYFKIAGEKNYHLFETSISDKIEAGREWFKQRVADLSSHELTRLRLRTKMQKDSDVVILMAMQPLPENDEGKEHNVRICYYAMGV